VSNSNLPAIPTRGGGLWPAHVPRPHAPDARGTPGMPGTPVAPASAPDAQTPSDIATERWPWRGVQWTLAYIGLLGFVFAITTYRFPIGDVSMVCAAVGLLTQRERFRLPPILIGLALFVLWCVIGYSITREPQLVFPKLQLIGKILVIGIVAVNALRTRPQIRFFIVFWLACFAFYPVRGALFNYYIYHETVFGRAIWNYIFANPNDLAAYCILLLSLALGLLALERRGPVKMGAIAGLAVIPFLILLTKSRGAFLGFAAFLLIVNFGQRRRMRALGVTILVAVIVISVAPKDVLNRVQNLEKVQGTENLQDADEEGSALQRYEIWKVARTIIRDYPITGVGIGAYPSMHAFYARRAEFDPTARGRRDTHSLYLNLTAETGFVGLLLFLTSYWGTLFWVNSVRKRVKPLLPATSQALYVFQAGTIGFFVAAIFGSMAHVSFLIIQVTTTWALADVANREFDALTAKKRRPGDFHVARGATLRDAV
jgi:probable O-glycosylation ligase (exosortase A-associated)